MVKSFRKFTKKSRKGHLAWGNDDITVYRGGKPIEPTKPDRSGHLSWKASDVEFLRKNKPIKEEKPVTHGTLDYEHAPVEEHKDHSIDGEHHEYQQAHRDTFTKPMDSAAYHYKDSSAINKHLRTGASIPASHKDRLPMLDKVVDHPTSEDMHVYRGFAGNHIDFSKLKVGDVIHDKGFTGTSLKHHIAHGFSDQSSMHHDHLGNKIAVRKVAKIHVPKGMKGHYIDMQQMAHHEVSQPYPAHTEDEFLLKRGGHYQITGHSKMTATGKDHANRPYEKHYHMIHMKLIKQD